MQNDMRDRLVKTIGNCLICHFKLNESWEEEAIDTLADHLIANGVIVPQWISVDDRLPNEGTRVLVYLNIKKLDANTYTYFDTDRLLNGKWVRWNSYITHWMPLPEPPKAEQKLKELNENG